ncbi:hypothetical protein [Shewanella pneumatophori]|uniref:Uncharacterized protein n=1 Tax=Shewanella pneumatophori TaxID=314092 RepID=A0A9X1ZFX9_9GAMM|nr:hypothetical protein [Shewanella pneumatophori]MCL1139125.1 hypothetical protein [Shewanella pneumatophori]
MNDKLAALLTIVGPLITLIWIISHYSSKSNSICARCSSQINYQADKYKVDLHGHSGVVCSSCQSMLNEIGLVLSPQGQFLHQCQHCKGAFSLRDRKNFIVVRQDLYLVCNTCLNQISLDKDKPMSDMLSNVITPEFLALCSNFLTLEELVVASKIQNFTADHLKSAEWNNHIRLNTKYDSWDALFIAASIYARDSLLIKKLTS